MTQQELWRYIALESVLLISFQLDTSAWQKLSIRQLISERSLLKSSKTFLYSLTQYSEYSHQTRTTQILNRVESKHLYWENGSIKKTTKNWIYFIKNILFSVSQLERIVESRAFSFTKKVHSTINVCISCFLSCEWSVNFIS